MLSKDYRVSHQGRRWQFEVDGDLFGPYSTEGDAIAAAVADAREALREGCPAVRILAATRDGTWELRWDSGAAAGPLQHGD